MSDRNINFAAYKVLGLYALSHTNTLRDYVLLKMS